jgi:hypothetical protein
VDAAQAVEVYNHNNAMAGSPDRAHGAYMLDGLLEKGYRVLVNAGVDEHFGHPADRFGGWVEVHCEQLDPETLLDALKAGRYYSTPGPALHELLVDGDHPYVQTSEAYAITLIGSGDRWLSGTDRTSQSGAPISEADFDLSPFRGSYCRIIVVDLASRRAWSNPTWALTSELPRIPVMRSSRPRSKGGALCAGWLPFLGAPLQLLLVQRLLCRLPALPLAPAVFHFPIRGNQQLLTTDAEHGERSLRLLFSRDAVFGLAGGLRARLLLLKLGTCLAPKRRVLCREV